MAPRFFSLGDLLADVDGYLISSIVSSPTMEQANATVALTAFYNPKVEDLIAVEVSNSTVATGGGGVVVRQDPPLLRTTP
jgi:hypothetical protein